VWCLSLSSCIGASVDAERRAAALRAFRRIDWPRAVNRVSTLVRALRGDPELEADQQRERLRAAKIHDTIEKMGRQAVGCIAPNDCDCPLCTEAREDSNDG